jgi:hypothetical protein
MIRASFEEAFAEANSKVNQQPNPQLKRLLRPVYELIVLRPSNLPALKAAMEELLEFLNSTQGRTEDNLWATDLFFFLEENGEAGWEHLPEEFQNILSRMGSALHDTFRNPEFACEYDCLPEQLLDRLKRITV